MQRWPAIKRRGRTGLTLAGPSVRGVSIVTGDARLAVFASGQVLTSLTDTLVDTFAVPVTLAGWGQKKKKKKKGLCRYLSWPPECRLLEAAPVLGFLDKQEGGLTRRAGPGMRDPMRLALLSRLQLG